jgi:acid phosphatase (class A)
MIERSLRASLGGAVAVLLLAAGVAAADTTTQPAATVAKPEKTLKVLTAGDIDAVRLLPPPAAEGSDAEKAELAELHRVIDAASPERMAQAKWDDDHEDTSLFYATIGGGFDLKALPATARLLDIVANDTAFASSAAKKTFARKRPWAVDPTIKTCDPDDKPLTSYPSGHSILGYSQGLVLATLIPAKAEAIQARAADYALSRQICGSHYRSDAEASHVMGVLLAAKILEEPAMQAAVAAARAELKAKGFTS